MTRFAFNIFFALTVLIAASPLIAVCLLATFLQDFHSPLFLAKRIGKGGRPFIMIKMRTMRIDPKKNKIVSTSADDDRITFIGRLIRKGKIDELMQFVNVLIGNMAIVGPRPLPKGDYDKLSPFEQHAYSQLPGITDFSSIVFSDEGHILLGHPDADSAYDKSIRPWKSRLVYLYMYGASLGLDIKIILFTAIAIINRKRSLRALAIIARDLGATDDLVHLIGRQGQFPIIAPPTSQLDILKEK